MDVNLARTFLVVAEPGSFVDTARKLNITQSTVSARIKGLEDLLGRPLFTRSKSGAELTGAGELFQKHALAMVRVWQPAPGAHIGRRAFELMERFFAEMGGWTANSDPRYRGIGDGRSLAGPQPKAD